MSIAGPQFMTYNVHQLLHLTDSVEDLGPLWSHSCFFFEDLNGDFRDLFHGTQNIDGQVGLVHIMLYSSMFNSINKISFNIMILLWLGVHKM